MEAVTDTTPVWTKPVVPSTWDHLDSIPTHHARTAVEAAVNQCDDRMTSLMESLVIAQDGFKEADRLREIAVSNNRQAQEALARVRRQVTDKVTEVVASGESVCITGANRFLADIGAEPISQRYTVTMSFTISAEVEEATDEDDAYQQARDNVESCLYDFQVDDCTLEQCEAD